MNLTGLRKKVEALKKEVAQRQPPDLGSTPDPVQWAEESVGVSLDPWQIDVLRSNHPRELILASRQTGKSEAVSLKAASPATEHTSQRAKLESPPVRSDWKTSQKDPE